MRRHLPTALLLSLTFAQTAVAAPAGGTATVTIDCPVAGATVAVDGKNVGTVPVAPLKIAPGKHVVTVQRRGLIDFREQMTVKAGDALPLHAVPPKTMALLTIQTVVSGAEVLVDGKVIGTLPITAAPVEPGTHRMFVRGPGLQPYQESFKVEAWGEHVSKPVLKTSDGSIAGAVSVAGGGLDLEIDLEPAPPVPPPAPVAAKSAGKPAAAPAPAPAALALDLDLDGDDLPPLVLDDEPAKPVVVAAAAAPAPAAVKPAAAPPATAAAKPAPAAAPKPAIAAATPATKPPAVTPAPVQPPVVVAAREPPKAAPVASFATDPVAAEQARAEQEPPQPIYKQKWLWAATAAVVVAAVAVPVATGRTGGYREVRDPATACANCLVVMNR